MPKNKKIIITGAAGLVGQNLTLLLGEQGYSQLVAVDKHQANLKILSDINPNIESHCLDLADEVDLSFFEAAACVVILQAQITGLRESDFVRNNVTANEKVLAACKHYKIPYVIQISSSVMHSKADDFYVQTKKAQEQLALDSGLPCTVLRPTLMFGWFDPKHFGWLSRFMEKIPIFPVPSNGKFVRQPLYNRDFCRVIQWCIENQPVGKTFDIVGAEDITYIDIIKMIKRIKNLKVWVLCIPYHLFYMLLKIYAVFDDNPPFTTSQLKALMVGDYFEGVDTEAEFGIKLTPLKDAFEETFSNEQYSSIVIERL